MIEVKACLKHNRIKISEEAWTQTAIPTNKLSDVIGLFNHNNGITHSFAFAPCDLCGVAK